MSVSDTSASSSADLETAYSLDLETVYHLAETFLNEKAEKAFHLNFDNRIILSALGFQVKYGKYETNKTADPGFFDFIGKRRIAQWQKLGDMSQEQAKAEYVRRIEQLCPLFRSYVEAFSRNSINSGALSHSNSGGCLLQSAAGSPVPSDQDALAFIKQYESDIRAALNSQTRDQFEQYALQQFPSDANKRAELITHLQDRHFHEYTAYARKRYAFMHHQQQQQHQQIRPTSDGQHNHCLNSRPPHAAPGSAVSFSEENIDSSTCDAPMNGVSDESNSFVPVQMSTPPGATKFAYVPNGSAATPQIVLPDDPVSAAPGSDAPTDGTQSDDRNGSGSPALVQPASMWTRSEVQEFKTSLFDSKDSVIRVGCGEVITVRVPAYPSGSSIVWEFATDDYDIGFGLYFEWDLNETKHTERGATTGLPSHDSDSMANPTATPKDTVPATGTVDQIPPPLSSSSLTEQTRSPLIDEIVPVFRRNSHQEIYCGSHLYPGLGTYLFKFDNSYSLWRSKTLYYRVYYTC